MSDTVHRRLSYREVLREYPGFKSLWLGDVVSFTGDWFNTIALYTAVQELTPSAQAIAAVMVAKMLPPFLIAPIAGPIVDRYDRRKILLATDYARAVVAASLIVSYNAQSLVGLFAGIVVLQAISGIAFPAKTASVPQLVPLRHIPVANALSAGTWSVMLALGATLGGVTTAFLGIRASFGIDSLTFLVSAYFFWQLPKLKSDAAEKGSTGFTAGLRYMFARPYVALLTHTKAMMGMLGGVLVLLPLFGTVAFPETSGPLYIGLLYGARGTGALIGSMFIRLAIGDAPRTMRRAIPIGFIVAGFFYSQLSQVESVYTAAVCFVLAACGSGMIWVYSGTLLQVQSSPQYHGRLFAYESGLLTLVMATSSWLAGVGIDAGLSLGEVAVYCSATVILPTSAWALFLILGRAQLKRAAAERLEAAYAIAAQEQEDVARSRRYRYNSRMESEDTQP